MIYLFKFDYIIPITYNLLPNSVFKANYYPKRGEKSPNTQNTSSYNISVLTFM